MTLEDIPPNVLCENCGKRKATVKWVGDGGWMAFTHGMFQYWCEVCSLKAQIQRIKERNKELPKLRRRLWELARQ